MEKINSYFRAVVNSGSISMLEDQCEGINFSKEKDEPTTTIPPTK